MKLWVSEAVLWTTWAHRGSLQARTECRLLAIDSMRFVNIMTTYPSLHASLYATKFVESLNNDARDRPRMLSDIPDGPDLSRAIAIESFTQVDPFLVAPPEWGSRKGHTHISVVAS